MSTVARRLSSLALVAGLAGCSGGGGSAPVPSSGSAAGTPATPGSSSTLGAIRYGAETTLGAALQAKAPPSGVGFGVLVKMRDPLGLVQYAASANDPKSGNYRHWLTPQDLANRYGATQADYTKVASYFRGKGLAVAGWNQRQLLYVHGSRTAAEAALGAHFGTYLKNGTTFTALRSAPVALAGLPIASLPGASTYATARRKRQFVKATGTPPFAAGYSAAQIASAFDYTGAYHAGFTGTGIKIGIIGTGPISQPDYAAYRGTFHVPGASKVTQVDVTDAGTAGTPAGYGGAVPAGTFATPPPTTAGCNIPATGPDATCNPEDAEAQIDTQQTFALAYGANVLFYLGYVPANTLFGPDTPATEGIELYEFEIQQAINDDQADVLSLSFGEGELDDVGDDFNLTNGTTGTVDFTTSPGPMQFASLVAEGIAVYASSGDNGDLQCLQDGNPDTADDKCVAYPSIDPNVVAVGGVNSPIGVNGRLVGPLTAWGAESGGYDPAFGASNGGVSAYFPQPKFQNGAKNVIGSTRNSPDVSLVGDPNTGVSTVIDAAFSDGGLVAYGGTSVAAPQNAAMWALVLQACEANTACVGPNTGAHAYRLGDPNTLLYAAYATPATYASTFYDVVFGDNSQLPCSPLTSPTPCPAQTPVAGYLAGVGYDRVTGLGVPFGRALVKTIAGI